MSSDLIFYHFGVHYELFDAILLGNGTRAKQVVMYHNITPAHLLPLAAAPVIHRSLKQRANLASANLILAVSEFNKQDLIQFGIAPGIIDVVPLYLRFGAGSRKARNDGNNPLEVLYVGRFVESKGVLDLIAAFSDIQCSRALPLKLRLVGNLHFSDPLYVARLKDKIRSSGLTNIVDFIGNVTDEDLQKLYASADIFVMPSFHEGFCVPVLEAMSAGCIPITYAAGNLPELVGNRGIIVETGNTSKLSAAIAGLAKQFLAGRPEVLHLNGVRIDWTEYQSSLQAHVAEYSFASFARRLKHALSRAWPANSS